MRASLCAAACHEANRSGVGKAASSCSRVSINRAFARRATNALLAGRDGLLPMASETPTSSDDMELVTWLIIMQPKSSFE